MNKQKLKYFLQVLDEMYPDAHCELHHRNSFELTIAVLLSAQCTDEKVNAVTSNLFMKYREPEDYLAVSLQELEQDIRSIGLFRNKAKHIRQLCQQLIDLHQREIPGTYEQLVALPGVGRKTANVVLSNAFGIPAIAVDTHVERVSKRLAIANWKDSVLEVEKKLMRLIPKELWSLTHHRLIFFGRYHCKAQNPSCSNCLLLVICREGRKRMRKLDKSL